MATRTPWGLSQQSVRHANGITEYQTARHGGIKLSEGRQRDMPDILREFEPFAGPGWYEEDCDWAIAVLSYPLEFPPPKVKAALDSARAYHSKKINMDKLMRTKHGALILQCIAALGESAARTN